MNTSMHICQIAFCCRSIHDTLSFYEAITGFIYCGGLPLRGPIAAKLFEVEKIQGRSYWLSGGDESFFQLEFFSLDEPIVEAPEYTIKRVGYNIITLSVPCIDDVIERLENLGYQPEPRFCTVGERRHACIRDPDNVFVELVEDAYQPIRLLGLGLTVESWKGAQQFFAEALSLSYTYELPDFREKLWGNDDVELLLNRFYTSNYWIEVRYYPENDTSSLSSFSLVEPGMSNIAFGFHSSEKFYSCYDKLIECNSSSTIPPFCFMEGHNVYMRSAHGISIELLQLPKKNYGIWGFRKPGIVSQLIQDFLYEKIISQ